MTHAPDDTLVNLFRGVPDARSHDVTEPAVRTIMNSSSSPLPRPPGKPRGHPKPPGSGRAKGTKNHRTLEVEAVLRPAVPKARRALVALLASEDLDIQVRAIQLILGYVFGRPVDRQQISGPNGAAIQTQALDTPQDKRAVALTILGLLSKAAPLNGLLAEPARRIATAALKDAADEEGEAVDVR